MHLIFQDSTNNTYLSRITSITTRVKYLSLILSAGSIKRRENAFAKRRSRTETASALSVYHLAGARGAGALEARRRDERTGGEVEACSLGGDTSQLPIFFYFGLFLINI
jgi:hypothetical protein